MMHGQKKFCPIFRFDKLVLCLMSSWQRNRVQGRMKVFWSMFLERHYLRWIWKMVSGWRKPVYQSEREFVPFSLIILFTGCRSAVCSLDERSSLACRHLAAFWINGKGGCNRALLARLTNWRQSKVLSVLWILQAQALYVNGKSWSWIDSIPLCGVLGRYMQTLMVVRLPFSPIGFQQWNDANVQRQFCCSFLVDLSFMVNIQWVQGAFLWGT